MNMLKSLPLAIACLSSAALFAGMDMDSRVSQLESQMKQVRTATDNNGFGAKTGSANPILDEGSNFYLGIGATYQNAIISNTDYAYSDNDASAAYPVDGTLRESGDNFSWGINAMIGYYTSHDGFDLRLVNSYFNTDKSNSVSAGFGGTIVPSRALSTIFNTTDGFFDCSSAKATLDVTYDLLGLELARDFFVSQYLSLRPNYGLLTSWLWNKEKVAYSGGTDLGVHSVYTEDYSNWWGIGPQFGLDTQWALTKGVSIFADTKAALMYGRFKVYHTEDYSASTASPDSDITAYGHRIVPYIQAVLGLSYNFYSDNNKNHFIIRAGYNTQFFLGAVQTLSGSTQTVDTTTQEYFTRTSNNLQTQGLLLDFAWEF